MRIQQLLNIITNEIRKKECGNNHNNGTLIIFERCSQFQAGRASRFPFKTEK